MTEITVERDVAEERLEKLAVRSWPVWEKEASSFPWHYDSTEICYLLEGDVVVTPTGGEPVSFGAGDLVTFPSGMGCHWEIRKAVRKHYSFE